MNQKKSSRPWSFRIKDILDAIERIQEFTKGMTFAEFDKNRMVQDAVIRNFEIIREAGNHIPVSIQNKYPHIPWKQIISMRNSLIHEYFGADNSVVWDTIQLHSSYDGSVQIHAAPKPMREVQVIYDTNTQALGNARALLQMLHLWLEDPTVCLPEAEKNWGLA